MTTITDPRRSASPVVVSQAEPGNQRRSTRQAGKPALLIDAAGILRRRRVVAGSAPAALQDFVGDLGALLNPCRFRSLLIKPAREINRLSNLVVGQRIMVHV